MIQLLLVSRRLLHMGRPVWTVQPTGLDVGGGGGGGGVRALPRTLAEYGRVVATPPRTDGHVVKVAVIGDPNVGKSTLINKLVGREVCPASRKAHTTRASSRVAVTRDTLQMELLDTPGAVNRLHARKHSLPKEMLAAPFKALLRQPRAATDDELDSAEARGTPPARPVADVVAVVVDSDDHWRRDFLSDEIVQLLQRHRQAALACSAGHPDAACSVLVLNKVDRLKSKRKLLTSVDSLCDGIVGGKPLRRPAAIVAHSHNGKHADDLKTKIWQREQQRKAAAAAAQAHSALDDGSEAAGVISEVAAKVNNDVDNYDEEVDSRSVRPADRYAQRSASWPHFARVFMVSAATGDGIDELRAFLESRARPGAWFNRPEMVSDQRPQQLVQDLLRERLLENTSEEIPYEVKPRITHWNVNESDALEVQLVVECRNERQVRAVLGKEGRTIRRVTAELRQRMCDLFLCEVALKLAVVNVVKPKSAKNTSTPSATPPSNAAAATVAFDENGLPIEAPEPSFEHLPKNIEFMS